MSDTTDNGDGPSQESIYDAMVTVTVTEPIEFYYGGTPVALLCTALGLTFDRTKEAVAGRPAFVLGDVESGVRLTFPADYYSSSEETEIILTVPLRAVYRLGAKAYAYENFKRILAAAMTAYCDPPKDRGMPFVDDWPASVRYVWSLRFEPEATAVSPTPQPEAVPEVTAPEPAKAARKTSRLHPILKWTALTIVGFFCFSILSVAVHRFVPVPITFLMIERMFEGKGLDHRWVPASRISDNLKAAVIASEDQKFCFHKGFDIEAIEKAQKYNARHKKKRGASTISQQTAKNVFLWPSRSWIRKGFEVWYTFLIEHMWPKERILEVYLNSIEWAPGVYGAEAASQHWFHHSAATLSKAEAARLAAILPSPLKMKANGGKYVSKRSGAIQRGANVVEDGCAAD